jgi:hypothetical protein
MTRVDEIMRIEPRILGRQQVLLSLIHLAELYLEVTKNFLDKLLEFDGFTPLFDSNRRAVVADHIEFLAQELQLLDFNPYRQMCVRTAQDMRSARDILRLRRMSSADWSNLRELLMRCHVAITLKNIQVAIERVMLKLTLLEHRGGVIESSELLPEVASIASQLMKCDDSVLDLPVAAGSNDFVKLAREYLYLTPGPANLATVKDFLRQASAAL